MSNNSRIKRVQQNLSLSADVVNNLRILSSYRKFKMRDSAEISAIVENALQEYFQAHSKEIEKATKLAILADDDDDTTPPAKTTNKTPRKKKTSDVGKITTNSTLADDNQ